MRRVAYLEYIFLGVFLTGLCSFTFAQDKPPKTNKIDQNPRVDISKEGPKAKKYLEILKSDTQGILYGNLCFEEFTRSKGYIYVIQPQPNPIFKARFKKSWHNFGVKLIITLKHSIFWKVVEKNKTRECRQKTGDRVG
ncbi:MAG TPA: hypothetical protein VGA21_12450 [Cyclobacteriaceae bacterium]|jgi:hypothetical protein